MTQENSYRPTAKETALIQGFMEQSLSDEDLLELTRYWDDSKPFRDYFLSLVELEQLLFFFGKERSRTGRHEEGDGPIPENRLSAACELLHQELSKQVGTFEDALAPHSPVDEGFLSMRRYANYLYLHPLLSSLSVFVVCLICFFIGCTRIQRPEGLPRLYDVTVQITQDGTSLADADVILYSADSRFHWTFGGRTDKNGVARIVTHGQYPGLPLGKFKVAVSKNLVVEPEEESGSGMPGVQKKFNKIFDLVDPVYKTRDTTPLEFEVEGKTVEKFDVGKPVRVEVKMPW